MLLQIKSTLYLRKDKQQKDDSYPVYIRFTRINGVEPKFPFGGMTVQLNEWNNATRRPKDPVRKNIADKEVARIELQINNAIANGQTITPDLLKRFVNGRNEQATSFYGYFNEYVQKQCKRGKMRDSTRAGYDTTLRLLKQFRGEIRLEDINTKLLGDFEQFMIERGKQSNKGEVKGSRSNRLKHINAVLHYIERQGVKVDNPYKKGDLEIPQADVNDVFLHDDELSELANLFFKTEAGTTDYRVLCMFLFSCTTGLRLGDALALEWQEIDWENEPLILEITVQKTNKKIMTPIPELGVEMLLYAAEGNIDNVDWYKKIFLCDYSSTTINNTLRKLAKQVGIERRISYHCSRRTFITLARMAGVDEYVLMNYAGHSDPKMTRRYMKWDKKLATDSANKIELFKLKNILKRRKKH